jgi:hypothetical protein
VANEICFHCALNLFTGNSPVALGPNVEHDPLVLEVPRSHTTTQSSGQVIISSQRLLPDKTHSRQTLMSPAELELTTSAGEWQPIHAVYRATIRTGRLLVLGSGIIPTTTRTIIIIIIIESERFGVHCLLCGNALHRQIKFGF